MGHAEKIYLLGTSKNVKTKCVASLIDLYHLKHSELEKDLQKCKSRGEDNVEDDSGHGAAFAQGASASQMAAASFLDTMSRLPGHGWRGHRCSISLHGGASVGTLQIITTVRERKPTSLNKDCHPVGDPHSGIQLRNQWFLLSEMNTVIQV